MSRPPHRRPATAARAVASGPTAGPGAGDELALERVVFLSDAVFAIAMTLLVLELRLPALEEPGDGDALRDALLAIVPRLGAYALSFAILGAYWLSHWRRYHRVARADGRLAWLNLLFLGLVAVIPFPTAVIGEHGDLPLAVVLYALSLSLAGLAGTVAWLYASRAGLTADGTPTGLRDSGTLRGLVVPAVLLGSLVLLPVLGPYGVELSWIAIVPLSILARPARQA
jgi:uncharacterized membrane protein